ncbi:MAG: hypothetical protein KAY46_21740 [Burkholderiaceae bacterium]|nr:hypothetical protein [Burkholderiaceae bacterium]
MVHSQSLAPLSADPRMVRADPRLARRRRWILQTASLLVLPMVATAAVSPIEAAIAFDRQYIPPLFLTGRAAASPEFVERAGAAFARLEARWPALRDGIRSSWPEDANSRRLLAALDRDLAEARRRIDARDWSSSHAALEPMRERLRRARQSRGIDYALDRYTRFHEAMERLVDRGAALAGKRLSALEREGLLADFIQARAHWQAVERAAVDPKAFGMTPARETQWRTALQDEARTLGAVSQALRGDDDAALLKTVGAVKAPFVRAYTAFGDG